MSKKQLVVIGNMPEDLKNGKTQTVIKVQLPLTDGGQALIYDNTKEWNIFMPVGLIWEAMNGEDKKYFLASIRGGNLVIHKEVGWQNW